MIKKIKASKSEKFIFIFLILLGIITFSGYFVVKNKCLFVKNFDPKDITFKKPNNIAILNAPCGNVIIELYPNISPNAVKRFVTLIRSNAYENIAFHRVIENKLIQAGDLEFGKKGNLDYGKIGTGKSGLGTIKSEINNKFNNSNFKYAECSTCTKNISLEKYQITNGFFTEYSKSTALEDMAEVYSHMIFLKKKEINQIRKLDSILNNKISYIEDKIKEIDNSFTF